MSKDEIKLELRSANMPLIRTLAACTITLCGTMLYLGKEGATILNDIKNIKEWKTETQPEMKTLRNDVSQLKTDVSVLNVNMNIVNSKLQIK